MLGCSRLGITVRDVIDYVLTWLVRSIVTIIDPYSFGNESLGEAMEYSKRDDSVKGASARGCLLGQCFPSSPLSILILSTAATHPWVPWPANYTLLAEGNEPVIGRRINPLDHPFGDDGSSSSTFPHASLSLFTWPPPILIR